MSASSDWTCVIRCLLRGQAGRSCKPCDEYSFIKNRTDRVAKNIVSGKMSVDKLLALSQYYKSQKQYEKSNAALEIMEEDFKGKVNISQRLMTEIIQNENYQKLNELKMFQLNVKHIYSYLNLYEKSVIKRIKIMKRHKNNAEVGEFIEEGALIKSKEKKQKKKQKKKGKK